MAVLVELFCGLLTLYSWVIAARALISWFEPDPENFFFRFMVWATEPTLRPLRRLLPAERTAGLDLTPIAAYLLIGLLKHALRWSVG